MLILVMNYVVPILLGIVIVCSLLFIYAHPQTVVTIDSLRIPVSAARTPIEWKKGLSGSAALARGRGMLFVFPHPDYYEFWMKRMRFSLDIIFIDSNKRIVQIVDIAPPPQPGQKPVIYRPSQPVSFVLEVNSGFARQHGIMAGQQAVITGL